jgi:hypothetical protein
MKLNIKMQPEPTEPYSVRYPRSLVQRLKSAAARIEKLPLPQDQKPSLPEIQGDLMRQALDELETWLQKAEQSVNDSYTNGKAETFTNGKADD